jgi:hypothetical protein
MIKDDATFLIRPGTMARLAIEAVHSNEKQGGIKNMTEALLN